eukprot:2675516-Amphidinium_carterae.2
MTHFVHSLFDPQVDVLVPSTTITTNTKVFSSTSRSTSTSVTKVHLTTTTTTASDNTKVTTSTSTSRTQAVTKVLLYWWSVLSSSISELLQEPRSTISAQPPTSILDRAKCYTTSATITFTSHNSTVYTITCLHSEGNNAAVPMLAMQSLLAAADSGRVQKASESVQQELQSSVSDPAAALQNLPATLM